MTREEFKKIQSQFGEEGDLINYNSLSQQLGLHKNSFNFVQGTKSKNLKFAAQKMKAMHATHTGHFMLEPIQKPMAMTARGDPFSLGNIGLNKSGSTSLLLKNNSNAAAASLNQNRGLIMKMVKNFDIDQTGLVSTQNLTKVFKLLGLNFENKVSIHHLTYLQNVENYKSGEMVRYERFVDDYCN